MTLDAAGQCCAGALDACGACDGNGTATDIAGACCSGGLDAAGRCCEGSAVDEFGVCGGRTASGIVELALSVATNGTQGGAAAHPVLPKPDLFKSHKDAASTFACTN